MKVGSKTVYELLSHMKVYFQGGSPKHNYTNEEPLRAELFSSDQMEHYGQTLAERHKISTKRIQDHLLKRLADNEKVLLEVRKLLTDTIKGKYLITPAGEWLIDNFYLIEEQIRTAKRHFPKNYSEEIPHLLDGESAGAPRVYDIALQIISHSDGHIDLDSLSGFVNAYQSKMNLQLGELWAIPIMLRLALIENLRRVSARIAIDRIDRNLADYWSKQMSEAAENDPKSLILVIADMARSGPPLVSAFVSELIRQLRGKGPALALALNWIEQRLSESGLTSDELVNAENQKQAADQVSISNSIGSLRMVNSMDWRSFVEDHSIVEQTLRLDPSGMYAFMDFTTRDSYRHVVEYLAKKSKETEYDIANAALQLSKENDLNNISDNRTAHVGYFLVGEGLPQIKKAVKIHRSVIEGINEALARHPLFIYLGSITIITAVISVGLLLRAYTDTKNNWLLIIIGVALLLCVSQFAVAIVNFLATLLVNPRLLPRMDFSEGIPPASRSLVVIPSMLTSTEDIEKLVEDLEVRFLANRTENLHFGLLTDFVDAPKETMPEDDELLSLVHQKIEALNQKYERERSDLFYLFHRPRSWNPYNKIWMGYERKRGKLSQLNELLRGKSVNNFSVIIGDLSVLQNVRYVITLDVDTQLPHGTAWKMIGTMAHPLNRAVYNEKKQRVTDGYGILQPRVTVSLPEANSSLYARLHGNEPGIDPYTRATSDVYQDLFAEGSFIGKGIFEVDAFEKAMHGKIPENRILSHDLLEGSFARCGLLSDIQLYEKYPSGYDSDVKRRARWIRGDWQVAAWFLPFAPVSTKRWRRNPLSGLSRWKIFDNIRRSLVPIALTVLIIMGWLILPSSLFWTVMVSAIIISPIVIATVWDVLRKPKDLILWHHLILSSRSTGSIFIKTLIMLICFPYEAYFSLIAILRTCWRMLISHKKLLQWNPSINEEKNKKGKLLQYYLLMWVEPFLALAVLAYLIIYAPRNLIMAAPVLLLWMISPLVMWRTSKPATKKVSILSHEQDIFLQKLARKTWSFFERFVTDEDNWLPPDNFQQNPVDVIAHRTSPTNIGLSLLSNLTASDFGYISTGNLIERTANTIATIQKLEHYQGHLLNWYDTQSLAPLLPKYISTVDSGNLAGHLLVLKQGLLAIPNQKIINPRLFDGLRDTFLVLIDSIGKKDGKLFQKIITDLDAACNLHNVKPDSVRLYLEGIKKDYETIADKLTNDAESETSWWAQTFGEQIDDAIKDIQILTPCFLLTSIPSKLIDAFPVSNPTLNELVKMSIDLPDEINKIRAENNSPEENQWLVSYEKTIAEAGRLANERITVLEKLASQCDEMADMEWEFLYDKTKHLLSIGYKVEKRECDPSYYDLLASEARLAVFVAIAQGKLPEEGWFALGRLLTNAGGPILLSWSGSMFEYMMPLLVMPTYENTLLDQTYKAIVERQIEYGKQTEVPWGFSESGYNTVDANSNYQYRAFGVPGLGLKRGLGDDLVVAPYASVMGLMVAPEKSCQNLELMSEEGFEGRCGMYEAIDYTTSRLQRGQSNAVIQSFMAHHEGMSLLSFAYLLLDHPMQWRFEAEPQFQANLLLLQERIPKVTSYYAHTTDIAEINYTENESQVRVLNTPNTNIPEVQLLSNGRYHVMLTNAGGGYSRWKDLAVTRWREDVTRDNWGTFCYIRDMGNGTFWSNTHQPVMKRGETYEAVFSQGRADFRVLHEDLEAHTEIVVSPEDDIEMRRVHITNHSNSRKTIDVTSYAEVVIAQQASDAMQAAFSNLFVQTEIIPGRHAILCSRRPRSVEEKLPCMFHLMMARATHIEEESYETDRMQFIGRGNDISNPQAMHSTGNLSGSQGSVLDPIVSIRYKITLAPRETVTLEMITGMGDTREICEGLIEKYQDKHHKDRVFELAWTHSQVVLRQINATEADAQLYGRLASSIVFMNSLLRADPAVIIKNRRGQSGLWGYSVSGDLPIVLLQIEDQANMQIVQQLIEAHTYWRLKGLAVDLVIWNEDHGGYRQNLQSQIQSLIAAELTDRPGGIFIRGADQISDEDRTLFETVARIIISDSDGTLADHINRKAATKVSIPKLEPTQAYLPVKAAIKPLAKDILFYNGLGGFAADGKEYVISIEDGKMTPAPWVNVIANPNFGTVISENGQSYTWIENAHEMRLTPWSNDPISDSGGECFYLRDEKTGHFWSPTPLPRCGKPSYTTRHGLGYSVFEHNEDGIETELWIYSDIESAIKFSVLKIRNHSGASRRLSVTGYTEWVLGDIKSKTAMHVHTEIDPTTRALFAKNRYNTEFGERVAFFDTDDVTKTFTGDRTEFMGRNGNPGNPNVMSRTRLSGKVGVALDPCAAIQVTFDIYDGAEREVIFRLGAARNSNDASILAYKFRGSAAAAIALDKVRNFWKNTTSALQVETPDTAINLLANGWLTYQVMSSRLWGRSGFYQSGGAFGYRDQLQDVLSLLYTKPQLTRDQILLAASRQYKEGDVQHWWHPPVGRGVRTRCSDDYLWLPFVTSRYVLHTGDTGVLDEMVPFLEGRPLNSEEESYYDLPSLSGQSAILYNHCVRAIKHAFNYGEHGLPLMGTGDWNDGMDRVGHHGKGESVWLAFFLYDILNEYTRIAQLHNDPAFADECAKEAQKLKENIEKNGWDGKWYRRAYFDDGSPLGSVINPECQIDSLSQSWALFSGAADEGRARIAMESANERLVRKNDKIILLLDPPFDKSSLDPGYIKGYVPGVRENGGQYTHAAAWLTMAFAKMGDRKRTWDLLTMLNPINHGNTPEKIAVYKSEPYVMAADVYGYAPHTGRGGWTWYTGSAGWMYQLITESFLGLKKETDKLTFDPRIPSEWELVKLHYRFRNTIYHISISQKTVEGEIGIKVDGAEQSGNSISLVDDGKEHVVEVVLISSDR